MRWFFRLFKVLLTVLLIAIVIRVAFWLLHPVNLLLEHINLPGIMGETGDPGREKMAEEDEGKAPQAQNGEDAGNEDAKIAEEPEDELSEQKNQNAEPETDGTEGGSDFFMTREEVFALEDASLTDKLAFMQIMNKIGRSEAENILLMARDGVTFSEMEEIKDSLANYLTSEEIDKLNSILIKNKKLFVERNI